MSIVRRVLILALVSVSGIGLLAPLAARSAIETQVAPIYDLLPTLTAPDASANRGGALSPRTLSSVVAVAAVSETIAGAEAIPKPGSVTMEASLQPIASAQAATPVTPASSATPATPAAPAAPQPVVNAIQAALATSTSGSGGSGYVTAGAFNLGFAPDPAAIDRFAAIVGRAPGIIHYYQSWGGEFQPTHANTVVSRGATPLISWEPWAGLDASSSQDPYVRSYARAVKNWGGSVYLRVGHEMNLGLFPWSDPAKFIAGWRRMVDIFRAEGATNAKFVWCPNVTYGGYFPMKEYFPGTSYVDWLCLDGYNFGTTRRSGWESFDQVFGNSINQITALAPGKPLMIGEFSSAEQGGSKASWIANAFGSAIKKYPAIRAVVWFNENYADRGQADWRVETSQTSIEAYRNAMTDPYYHGKMP